MLRARRRVHVPLTYASPQQLTGCSLDDVDGPGPDDDRFGIVAVTVVAPMPPSRTRPAVSDILRLKGSTSRDVDIGAFVVASHSSSLELRGNSGVGVLPDDRAVVNRRPRRIYIRWWR